MKHRIIIVAVSCCILVLLSYLTYRFISSDRTTEYVVTALNNPGRIAIYRHTQQKLFVLKVIKTEFNNVYTVRIGDIYNNGKLSIITGISNSFYKQPYGCSVVSYDLETFNRHLIDQVGDLRCKDLIIGDADNDGKNEIVLGTHGIGIIRMYKWTGTLWKKEDLERNFIAQYDKIKGTNHQVSGESLGCGDCIINTAVHNVRVADIDGDGKNEVIVTESSPLEQTQVPEVSFIKVFKKTGNGWESTVVDSLQDREFRSITIDDVYHEDNKSLVIGIGSPRGEPASLYTYTFMNNGWQKKLVYTDSKESNFKGVAIGRIFTDDKTGILLASGFPQAKIMTFYWTGRQFEKKDIGTVASLMKERDAQYNTMATLYSYNGGNKAFFIGGTTVFPLQNIGWENSTKGFTIAYFLTKDKWEPKIIDTENILGMDIYN